MPGKRRMLESVVGQGVRTTRILCVKLNCLNSSSYRVSHVQEDHDEAFLARVGIIFAELISATVVIDRALWDIS